MKKGTACGPDSSEPFRYHKSRKLLGILGMMELTRMDKAMLFVFAMFVIVEISFAVAIIMGVKDPGSWAFGIIVVMVIDAWLTTSYLRHRPEYR
jgi:hypothetical protein